MHTPLIPGEQLVKKGAANLQRGAESVGGHLYLTTKRLIFEPHRLNFQTSIEIMPLEAVLNLGVGTNKFLVLPIPNVFIIFLANDQLNFIVHGRKKWLAATAPYVHTVSTQTESSNTPGGLTWKGLLQKDRRPVPVSSQPSPQAPVYDVAEALEVTFKILNETTPGILTHTQVQQILNLEYQYIQALPKDDEQNGGPEDTVQEYIQRELSKKGSPVTINSIQLVLNAEEVYLRQIGAMD